VQNSRFVVLGGYGCNSTAEASGATLLLVYSWTIIPPLISALFYCREFSIWDGIISIVTHFLRMRLAQIVYMFYKHGRDVQRFLNSTGSVPTNKYFRILAVSCMDVLLTLPTGIIIYVTTILGSLRSESSFPFYGGWDKIHAVWQPVGIPLRDQLSLGPWYGFEFYLATWSSIILGFAIFALFGFTAQARATYMSGVWALLSLFGLKRPDRNLPVHDLIGTAIVFNHGPENEGLNSGIRQVFHLVVA